VGCLAVQDDGQTRIVFGRTAANVCVVEGLERAKRFGPLSVQFDPSAPAAEPQRVAAVAAPLRAPRLADGGTIAIDGDLADWPDHPERPIMAGDTKLAGVRLAHDGTRLLVAVTVRDETPLVNGLADWQAAFRTGDAIDLCLGPAGDRGEDPAAGDMRVLLVPEGDGGLVVRYRPVVPDAPADGRVPFTSPIGTTTIDAVDRPAGAAVAFRKTGEGYACEAALPFEILGIDPEAGLAFAGDIGVLSSDGGGQQTVARNYLFNDRWTMTADLAAEAMLKPGTWGRIELE
jgi:hypothetical protein